MPPKTPAWDSNLLVNPHQVKDKRQRVQQMFAAIAKSYDLNNRLHPLGQDQRWRRKAVHFAQPKPTDRVIDVACGTGDLTLAFAHHLPTPLHPNQLLGIDFTFQMLPLARHKAQTQSPKQLPRFINGDALNLPLPNHCCDIVSIAFGIRNVTDPAAALTEFRRILRPGGRLAILEFSQPTNPLIRWANDLYCTKIMPHTATFLSRDKSGAYKYLPMSVKTFLSRSHMTQMIQNAGFHEVRQHPLTFGVCVCYIATVAP